MNGRVSRRRFIQAGAAAATWAAGAPKAVRAQGAAPSFAWGALWHMGTNMWSDLPEQTQGPHKTDHVGIKDQADYLRFDEASWQALTARMKAAGMNQVVIDLGEALQYQSHPELAVKGFLMASWLYTLPAWQEKNLQAVAQVEEMIRGG